MSADSAVTYTSVHSEARSWSIPVEDPYEEGCPTVVGAGHHSLQTEDEAPTPLLPPSFLSPRIRPLSPRALEVEMRDIASAFYHSYTHQRPHTHIVTSTCHHLLAAELIFPRLTCHLGRDYYLLLPWTGTPLWRPDFTRSDRRMNDASLELVNRRITYQVDVCTRETEIEVLRRERLAYEQEGMETRQALARSEAHCRTLEARVTVLETDARRHEWQRQAADDLAVQYIMRTQALEAGARVDTLEDTGSSS
ncbi:hypothetical protein Tco_1016959 [Tanacetum coccineum]|uniref:Uncharacterized protein n=1 Tax=Tanacetum coccineum TaxID=301880 RepID=A0ABQ5FR67_9ASTR